MNRFFQSALADVAPTIWTKFLMAWSQIGMQVCRDAGYVVIVLHDEVIVEKMFG